MFSLFFSNTSHNYNDSYTKEKRKGTCTFRGFESSIHNKQKEIMNNDEGEKNTTTSK